MTANMKAQPVSFIATIVFTVLVLPSLLLAQTTAENPPYSVVDRGPFYQVLQRTVSVTDGTGEVSQQVQSYTMLQDGLNYLVNGQYVEAQDLVEATSTGAQATHGQMVATFDGDITADGAISLSTATETFQSHPIGLFYADSASGKVTQIGAVQSSVGILYPPNIIVFSNAIPGLADVMLVWAKNGFEQNLVLKKNPPPPSALSMSSSSTTLQLWTAMDNWPTPQRQRAITLDSGLVDHIFYFSNCWFPVGSAFAFGTVPLPPQGQAAQVRVIDPSTPGTVPVAKSIESIAGSPVLLEQVRYTDLLPLLSTLPQASLGTKAGRTVELANRGQFLPAVPITKSAHRPMEIASARYSPKGVTLDYATLSGTASSFTFTNGTYLIKNSFTISPNTATFSNNACIKYYTNAYLMVEGPVSFPSSGSPVVFTSTDDTLYGEPITTNANPNPYYTAKPAVWFYYQGHSATMQDAAVRWAQQGVEFTVESGGPSQSLYSSVFQDCTTGVILNMPGNTLYLSGDTYCNVTTPTLVNSGSTYGSITQDCGVVSVAMVNDPNRDKYDYDTNKNSQTECSFAVLDSTNIVAAFMNTHLGDYFLGQSLSSPPASPLYFPGIPSPRTTSWAVSRNGGHSFTDMGPIPPISTITNGSIIITNGAPDPTTGDAGDTHMAYDANRTTYGTIYLLVNPSRETGFQGFRLWTSTNRGTNFTLLNTNVPGGQISGTDWPTIKVSSTGDLYACGDDFVGPGYVWAAHSSDGGVTWPTNEIHILDTTGGGPNLVITPDGTTVYVFWQRSGGIQYAWLAGGTWSYSTNLGITFNGNGSINPLRFSGDDAHDWFLANSNPHYVFANGCVYLVYWDLPYTNSTTDRGDIFLVEATTNSNHWLGTPTVRTVNNDRTATDQWDPSIAVNVSRH